MSWCVFYHFVLVEVCVCGSVRLENWYHTSWLVCRYRVVETILTLNLGYIMENQFGYERSKIKVTMMLRCEKNGWCGLKSWITNYD